MTNTAFIIGLASIAACAGILLLVFWLMFRKSFLFTIIIAFVAPLGICAMAGFVVGAKGIIHLTWALVVVWLAIFFAVVYLRKVLIQPIVKIQKTAESLQQGNTSVEIDKKYLKGSTEINIAMQMLNKLIYTMKDLVVFANNIGKGNLSSELIASGDKDEITVAMLSMRDNLKVAEDDKQKRQQEDEQRNWVTIGLAKFAELLRSNNDNLDDLCHSVISNLVKYTGANQGGIFILNDENHDRPVLEMKACYAYERRKFAEKEIEPGEGLVGTCFLERQSIYMTELPKDYIHITSGLGGETPSALLITPLMVNEEIYGIIEIAAFKVFDPHVKEFVEKVAESIASTISSTKTTIRTQQLLERSKLLAEEMANQEEELRQNMEEMQATQEEQFRRENELKETVVNMEKMLTAAEEFKDKTHWHEALLDAFEESPISVTDMNKNVTFLNKAALDVLGKTREEVIGKNCGSVWGVDICKNEKCGIEYLKCGKGKSVFNIGSNIFTTSTSYIKDRNGNNVGHIEVITNISEATNKSEYSKKEVEKLAENISKMAKGNVNCDFTVAQPDEYTLDEYNNFSSIAANLEKVRNTVENLLSSAK